MPPSLLNSSLQRKDWIASLEKGLELMNCFGEDHPRLSASDIARLSGLTRTAARRYLLTLQYLGYLASDGKLFWLTPRVLRLSQAYLSSSRLVRVAQQILQRIVQGTGENVFLSVLEGDSIVYIARQGNPQSGGRPLNFGYTLGTLVPGHITAAGIMMLALRKAPSLDEWLEQWQPQTLTPYSITDKLQMRQLMLAARLQDWAVSEQQLELNYRGIAVPVRDARGEVVAALSVTLYMKGESREQATARVLGVLQEAAGQMRNLV